MIKGKVSIIIPVYKVEQYLRTCLNSVLAQTYTEWEIILIDDGSPDYCGHICDEYASNDNRIVVIHKENGGLSSARNAALDYPPKGEFVTFLDSDDFWHHDYLKTLMDLQQKYNADLVQCGLVRGTEEVFPDLKQKTKVKVLDNHKVFLKERATIIMCGKLYKQKLFNGIRMPIGLYNEDDWTAWKLYYRAKTIVVTSKRLYYYTMNPNSIMAKLGRKPDLRYISAYDERIGFFQTTGEKDLEHCSRLQLMKSLLLNYRHNQLTDEEHREIKAKFMDSWKVLKHSPYIGIKYKFLFGTFGLMPMLTSKVVARLKS